MRSFKRKEKTTKRNLFHLVLYTAHIFIVYELWILPSVYVEISSYPVEQKKIAGKLEKIFHSEI